MLLQNDLEGPAPSHLLPAPQVNPACAAQSLVVPDLINGQEYLFRIRAENRFGFGPFTETPEGTKARDPIRMFIIFSPCSHVLIMFPSSCHHVSSH